MPRVATPRQTRNNYAGINPITRESGNKKAALAQFVPNDQLVDALGRQVQCAPNVSPGARAYYDRSAPASVAHRAALRQLAN
jgi:hypothetical protein